MPGDLLRPLSKLAPFGQGNPKPLFLLEQVSVNKARHFGKEKNHLELSLSKSNGRLVKAISFFYEGAPVPEANTLVTLLASLEESSFGGRNELRLRIVDIL